jgi:hypothetical protein
VIARSAASFIASCLVTFAANAFAFDGKIDVVITRGNDTTPLLYTVGETFLRIEITGSTWPNPIDIVDLKSGELTLVFPHNRSFMRLKSTAENPSAPSPGTPQMPTPPPGIGPQPNPAAAGPGAPPIPTSSAGLPPGIGPQSQGAAGIPSIPSMPAMPMMMPPMPMEKLELKATGKKEKILGYECEQFEIKQRGETMEIWATNKLIPFQDYMRNQKPRFGPRMIEEQWPELLTVKKLFPLRASLHFDNGPGKNNGPERFRFEVKSIMPGKIGNKDLFQPPDGYNEIRPLLLGD